MYCTGVTWCSTKKTNIALYVLNYSILGLISCIHGRSKSDVELYNHLLEQGYNPSIRPVRTADQKIVINVDINFHKIVGMVSDFNIAPSYQLYHIIFLS